MNLAVISLVRLKTKRRTNMWWLLLLLVIFVIVGSLIDFSCSGWNITKQFFTDSWWGIIAIATGIISILLFYASGKSYTDLKINESFLPNPKKFNRKKGNTLMTLNNQENDEVVEFDLSKLTMTALTKKMAYEMTKPGPVFFKGWGNRRLELDVQRVQIIQRYIESIRRTGDSLMELQADSFLSYEKIKLLTEEKRYQLEKRVVQSKIELDFAKEEYSHKIKMMKIERERAKEEVLMQKELRKKIKTDNLISRMKAEADYKLMLAKGLKERQIALIMAEAVKYYNELPNILKTFVTVQLGNEHAEIPAADMELQEQIKKFIIRKQEAEAKNLEYEVEENEAKKDTLKAKLELERTKYKNHG
jgi:hypothetical protein